MGIPEQGAASAEPWGEGAGIWGCTVGPAVPIWSVWTGSAEELREEDSLEQAWAFKHPCLFCVEDALQSGVGRGGRGGGGSPSREAGWQEVAEVPVLKLEVGTVAAHACNPSSLGG